MENTDLGVFLIKFVVVVLTLSFAVARVEPFQNALDR